jgi:hypothetical protein
VSFARDQDGNWMSGAHALLGLLCPRSAISGWVIIRRV